MKQVICGRAAEEKYYDRYYLADHKRYFSGGRSEQEAHALVQWLGYVPSSICDVACGDGRHLAAFRSFGVASAYGFDVSRTLITKARSRFVGRGGYRIERMSFDRWRPPTDRYDIVYSLFSALGCCVDEAAAEQLVVKMVKATKSRGLICIDMDNVFRLARVLDGRTAKVMKMKEKLFFDVENLTLYSRDVRAKEVLCTASRYYLPTELARMFVCAGIARKNINFLGGFSGEKYSCSSDRLIVLAKKDGRG